MCNSTEKIHPMNIAANLNNPTQNICSQLLSGAEIPNLIAGADLTKLLSGADIFPCYDLFIKNANAANNFISGITRYNNDFFIPWLTATFYFNNVELSGIHADSPVEQLAAYVKLFEFNMELFSRYHAGSMAALEAFLKKESKEFYDAFYNTIFKRDGENLNDFFQRQFDIIEGTTRTFPKAVKEIAPEYGFHFEEKQQKPFAQTDRFFVYEVLPTDSNVTTDQTAKPVLIIPPFVLGSNILGFLPGENRSYAHSFANQGIPTYIRIMKDIKTTPAFQVMTMEEDALDTRFFCEKIMEKHGRKVTLNGYCQGGYSAVCNILSGELDSAVDALITCVAPMDGTRSKGLGHFLTSLPPRFNNLLYGTKTLPNGNKVADGNLMGWVYKLKSIEQESPIVSFFRDMFMVEKTEKAAKMSKTALALNYWLQNERTDIPLNITAMSFASYNIPVKEDGTLPVTMFGRSLNFKTIEQKNIPWLLCYGESDDLVEKETALAPLDYIKVETTPFPKGHVAIATSWSHPESAYALHTRFGNENQYRGPVRFQMELNQLPKK